MNQACKIIGPFQALKGFEYHQSTSEGFVLNYFPPLATRGKPFQSFTVGAYESDGPQHV